MGRSVKRILGKLQGGSFWAHPELVDEITGALKLSWGEQRVGLLLVGYKLRPKPIEPTIGRLERDTGKCQRQINRILDSLSGRGLLNVDRQHGRMPKIDVEPLLEELSRLAELMRNALAWLHNLCREIGAMFGRQPRDMNDVVFRAQEAQRLAGWSNGELGDALERQARYTTLQRPKSVWGYLLTMLRLEAQTTAERKAEQEADERKLKEVDRAPAACETPQTAAAESADAGQPEDESGTPSDQPANPCTDAPADDPGPGDDLEQRGDRGSVLGSVGEEAIPEDADYIVQCAYQHKQEFGRWPSVAYLEEGHLRILCEREHWFSFAKKASPLQRIAIQGKLNDRLEHMRTTPPMAAAGGD